MDENHNLQISPGHPALGLFSRLRSRFRFSLRTLLECMMAYAAAFTAAICRPNRLFAVSILTVALITFVSLSIWQKRRRTGFNYFILAVVVVIGLFGGSILLHQLRKDAVATLLAQDQQTLEALTKEYAAPNLDSTKTKQLNRTRNAIWTRDCQLRDITDNIDIRLPKTPDEWSPLVIPPEKRLELRVTSSLVDVSTDEFMKEFEAAVGIRVEIDEDLKASWHNEDHHPNLTLRVSRMSANLWLDWVCKLENIEYDIDRTSAKLTFREPAKLR